MWEGKSITLVLPAYNEESNIVAAVEDFFSTGVLDEILVVDNNSKDRTASWFVPAAKPALSPRPGRATVAR